MGGRRQPNYNKPRLWIAKSGYGPSPVILIGKRHAFLHGNPFPPLHQAGTAATRHNLRCELLEKAGVNRLFRLARAIVNAGLIGGRAANGWLHTNLLATCG
jgi:hypothetical protein